MAAEAIAAVVLAFGLGVWTHWRYALSRALAEVQASCRHVWGETWEVGEPALLFRQRFYRQTCPRCASQRDVNADGTLYVPETK